MRGMEIITSNIALKSALLIIFVPILMGLTIAVGLKSFTRMDWEDSICWGMTPVCFGMLAYLCSFL